jgi:hypothetical protein
VVESLALKYEECEEIKRKKIEGVVLMVVFESGGIVLKLMVKIEEIVLREWETVWSFLRFCLFFQLKRSKNVYLLSYSHVVVVVVNVVIFVVVVVVVNVVVNVVNVVIVVIVVIFVVLRVDNRESRELVQLNCRL